MTKAHETNKDRSVYRHIVTLPNSYVTEYGSLILIPDSDYTSVPRLAEMANLALKEAEYPFLFTSVSILPYLKDSKVWVDNNYLAQEEWPKAAISKEQTTESKMIYMIDLEKVELG